MIFRKDFSVVCVLQIFYSFSWNQLLEGTRFCFFLPVDMIQLYVTSRVYTDRKGIQGGYTLEKRTYMEGIHWQKRYTRKVYIDTVPLSYTGKNSSKYTI